MTGLSRKTAVESQMLRASEKQRRYRSITGKFRLVSHYLPFHHLLAVDDVEALLGTLHLLTGKVVDDVGGSIGRNREADCCPSKQERLVVDCTHSELHDSITCLNVQSLNAFEEVFLHPIFSNLISFRHTSFVIPRQGAHYNRRNDCYLSDTSHDSLHGIKYNMQELELLCLPSLTNNSHTLRHYYALHQTDSLLLAGRCYFHLVQ